MTVGAFNSLIVKKSTILRAYNDVLAAFNDDSALVAQAAEIQGECEVALELMRKSVGENATTTLDQNEYNKRYDGVLKRYEAAKERLAEINDKLAARRAKREHIESFIKTLRKQDALLTEFDESLFGISVDRIIVHSNSEVTIVWKDGTETQWQIR